MKKQLSFIICVVMFASIFGGCRGDDDINTNDENTNQPISREIIAVVDGNGLQYEIKAFYEFCEMEGDYGSGIEIRRVLYVFEYPFFTGTTAESDAVAEKMNGVYSPQLDDIKGDNGYFTYGENLKEYNRTRLFYTYEDYLDELWPDAGDGAPYYGGYMYTTTCTVGYNKNNVISLCQQMDWYIGGIYNVQFTTHTFNAATGEEIEITDILYGTGEGAGELLAALYAMEYQTPFYDQCFYLSDVGLEYCINDGGTARGSGITVPYTRTDFVKPPFAVGEKKTDDQEEISCVYISGWNPFAHQEIKVDFLNKEFWEYNYEKKDLVFIRDLDDERINDFYLISNACGFTQWEENSEIRDVYYTKFTIILTNGTEKEIVINAGEDIDWHEFVTMNLMLRAFSRLINDLKDGYFALG